jgi:hypothetical protein
MRELHSRINDGAYAAWQCIANRSALRALMGQT